jgi:1,4-dihydroxy-2-naphthoate octaprenyltransferase
MTQLNDISTSPWKIWFLAARPKTLPAGIVPVLVAGMMAYADGYFHLLSFLAALLGSVMIQVGTNYANDLFDYRKEADTSDRIGPTRVTQAGLATPAQTAAATIIVFAIALIAGIYLVYRGGWPIVIVGLASVACGVLYTAGPVALGYIGVADLFVLVFFGPVALAGTYYVQALDISASVILAGIPFGMISTAILTVNNLRDISTDARSNKKTLAVRFGRNFAQSEYLIMLVFAVIAAAVIAFVFGKIYLLLTLLILPVSIPTIRTILTTADGEKLNSALAATGRLLILYGLLFGIGWWL